MELKRLQPFFVFVVSHVDTLGMGGNGQCVYSECGLAERKVHLAFINFLFFYIITIIGIR